jgi:hypothetical protein
MGAEGAWSNQLVNLIILAASSSGFSGFFAYSPAPGPGNLIASLTAAAGTDPYGNPYPAGLTIGLDTSTQLELASVGGVGQLLFLLNNALYGNGVLESAVTGGAGQIVLNGPKLLSIPDFVGQEWNSNFGSGNSANMEWIYTDADGTSHLAAGYGYQGFLVFAGEITGIHPGTGTSPVNAAVAETWQFASPPSGWTNDLIYKLYPDQTVGFAGTIILPSSGSYNGVTFTTLPAGYIPAGTKLRPIVCTAQSSAYGNNSSSPGLPYVQITSGGVVSFGGLPASINGKEICVDGVRFPIDI